MLTNVVQKSARGTQAEWLNGSKPGPRITRSHSASNRETVAQLLDRAAAYLQTQGQYTTARHLFERALAIIETALGPDHPDVGTVRDNLGNVLRDLGELPQAPGRHPPMSRDGRVRER